MKFSVMYVDIMDLRGGDSTWKIDVLCVEKLFQKDVWCVQAAKRIY